MTTPHKYNAELNTDLSNRVKEAHLSNFKLNLNLECDEKTKTYPVTVGAKGIYKDLAAVKLESKFI